MKNALFLVLLFCSKANAGNYNFVKLVDPYKLKMELESAGFSSVSIRCKGEKCRASFSGPGNPASIVTAHAYVDKEAESESLKSSISGLAVKLRLGTITQIEKDDLISKLLKHLGF